MSVATLISFCSNDYRLLKKCIQEAQKFSQQIIIAVCDHYFDGTKEDHEILQQCYFEYPECDFIEFPYLHNQTYSPFLERNSDDPDWALIWHSTSRYVPYFFVKDPIEYLLFLDVDEIVDGDRFSAWLNTKSHLDFDALRFQGYYYFREACYRSKTFQNTGLLVKKDLLKPNKILNPDDRFGIFVNMEGRKELFVPGLDGLPLIHHYSGVKTKQEWLKKSVSWGHHWEKDWKTLIEEEHSRPFSGKDFTFDYQYEKVVPFFDPLSIKLEKKKIDQTIFANVCKVDHKEIYRKEIEKLFLNE